MMVVIEGAILGLTGGAIGVVSAWSVTRLGRYSMTMEGLNVEISSDPIILVIGITIALALGVLAGIVPAWRVSRLEISQCFRAV